MKEYKTMARKIGIIIVGILLVFPAAGWAQRRAGRAFQGRPALTMGFAAQTPVIAAARRPIAAFPRTGFVRTAPIIIGPQDYGSYSPYFAPSPYFTPYPYFAPAPFNSTPIYYSEPAYVSPPVMDSPVVSHNDSYYDNTAVLSNQVQQLTQEIERLQQMMETQRPAAQASPAPQATPTPTTLVFRDGRQIQVLNYAVMGQTVWVLNQGTTTKISASELDLNATQRENRARGVRFPLGEK
jgi:hypothetical protein